MFENKIIRGIHTSRYIASWINATWRAEECEDRGDFKTWLRTLIIDGESLTSDEIQFIVNFYENGKLELEERAIAFLNNKYLH